MTTHSETPTLSPLTLFTSDSPGLNDQSSSVSVEYIPIPGEWERKEHPTWPDAVFQIPKSGMPGQIYYIRKGYFICNGATARIERLPTGEIVKTPLENPLNPKAESMNRHGMEREYTVYQMLGDIPFIPKFIGWDPALCTLTLEHQRNGSLDDYMARCDADPTIRTKWAVQAAQALATLHAKEIKHADVAPRNFLLDGNLDIRICDFAGSSIPESPAPPSAPGPRYQARLWGQGYIPTEADDIFGLGSVLFFIMDGKEVFSGLDDEEIQCRFQRQEFPATEHLQFGRVIYGCWTGYFLTAEAVGDAILHG
ncbi:kinase-like domain-containing protein [Stachybotrys elegans]|uniref:EKC/KEOPS complex subunit BUD32 n=1 Tax=Stachybotrys elegans TaxID=80388 RepID=A0A8K0SCY2_9HYPO|nr:kinase-like domain-containing protein [Stachybotrys elegans]